MTDRHPRIWLPLALSVITLGSFLLATFSLYTSHNAVTAQALRTEAATMQLCDLGSTLKDVVQGGIAVVYAELQDPNVPEGTHAADRAFLRRFHADLKKLNFLTSNPASACATLDERTP